MCFDVNCNNKTTIVITITKTNVIASKAIYEKQKNKIINATSCTSISKKKGCQRVLNISNFHVMLLKMLYWFFFQLFLKFEVSTLSSRQPVKVLTCPGQCDLKCVGPVESPAAFDFPCDIQKKRFSSIRRWMTLLLNSAQI